MWSCVVVAATTTAVGVACLRRRLFYAALMVAVGLPVAGCGVTRDQLDAAGSFGKSAAALADGAKTTYAQTANDERDLRFIKYVVLTSKEIESGEYKTSQVDLSEEKIKGRLAAAEALSAYGKALSTLLDSKTQESDFSSAATALTGAIKGIPKTTLTEAHITTDQIDSFGKVVVALGNIYLDYRRREVLEQVVPAAEPVVTKICLMFAVDFAVDGGLLGTMVSTELNETLGNLQLQLKKDKDSIQMRATLLPLYQRVDGLNSKISGNFDSLKVAARSCAKTSVKLRDAVKDPKVSLQDIADFASKAQAAYNAVHAIAGNK